MSRIQAAGKFWQQCRLTTRRHAAAPVNNPAIPTAPAGRRGTFPIPFSRTPQEMLRVFECCPVRAPRLEAVHHGTSGVSVPLMCHCECGLPVTACPSACSLYQSLAPAAMKSSKLPAGPSTGAASVYANVPLITRSPKCASSAAPHNQQRARLRPLLVRGCLPQKCCQQ